MMLITGKKFQFQSQDTKFINYKPSAAGAMERIIRMVEKRVDPLQPPKFKHKRVPGSPPVHVPIVHSPPRPVTVEDQKNWKIPPCISNWKNPKGYTIPLDKRLASDGNGLQQVQVNDHFVQLSEALYVAEQQAREAVSMRSKLQKELMMQEKERKEQELRALAQKAREGIAHAADHEQGGNDDTKERDKIREERRRERERERRGSTAKKRKITTQERRGSRGYE